MRNAMLAVIMLALSGSMPCAIAEQPQTMHKNEQLPPGQQQVSPDAVSSEAGSPLATRDSSRFLLGSGTAANGTADSTEYAARMFPAGLSKDFGAVPFGTQLLHRFEISNIYAIPVEIAELRVGCGCVTATAGKRMLQPGEHTTIDVTLDTRTFTGANTETVRVVIGPNRRSSCVLKVSAVSQSDVVCKPDRIINFGTVVRGQATVQNIDVEYSGTLAWEIKEVIVAKGLPIEAKLSEPFRLPGMVDYRLTVKLKDEAHAGRIRDYVYLKTNQIDFPLVPVLVTAIVQESPGVPPGASR